jgi:hypothetical protein
MDSRTLFKKAAEGDISILSDPNVSKVKDHFGETPLHVLSLLGKTAILKHPDMNKVKMLVEILLSSI